jgi:hypothetical protein
LDQQSGYTQFKIDFVEKFGVDPLKLWKDPIFWM